MSNNIVAASGYFDPLHVGHVEYLQLAKELAGNDGKLIVIINNTKQTHLKKGFEFMPCAERMKIIAALGFVDEVVESIDEDGSQCKTLEMLKPHIFAKGGDRYAYEIPEAGICRELGIKIVDGLGAKIQSSSKLAVRAKEFEGKK